MGRREIKTTLALDGEKAYQQAMAAINRELRVLDSEMAVVSSAFGKNQNSVESLTSKNKVLTQQIEQQKVKVDSLRQAVKESAEINGEADKRTDGYRIQLNNAEAALNKLNAELDENSAKILKQAEDLRKQSDAFLIAGKRMTELGGKMKDVGQKMTDVGRNLATYVTLPLVAAGTAAFRLASDVNESMNKVDVAFGDSSGEVKDWANSTLQSFGIARGTALDMAATFGDMGAGMGQTTAEAAKMSMSLVGLAGDLASFKNIGIDRAMDALRGIYTGEGEALKSLGVIMLDSTLKTYALTHGFQTQYEKMSTAEKVALRYAYVMDATRNSQGDFARTSSGAANQVRILQESIKELGASFGEVLMPEITPIITKATDLVQRFDKLDEKTKKTILVIAGIAAAVGPALVAIGSMASAIGSIVTVAGMASTAIAGAGGVIAVLTGPVGIATVAVAALAAGLIYFASTASDAADAAKELAAECEASRDAFYDQAKAINTDAQVAGDLIRELETLQHKVNRTNAENYRMAMLVSQLNKLYPSLNLEINAQTGLLNMNAEAIRKVVAEKKKEIQQKANEEYLLDLYKKKKQLTDDYTVALTRAKDAYETAKKVGAGGLGGTMGLFHMKELREAEAATNAAVILKDQLEKNAADIKASEALMDAYGTSVAATNAKTAESAMLTAEQLEAAKKYMEELESLTEHHMNQMGGLADGRIKQEQITAREIQRNLWLQIQDMRNFNANISALGKRKGISASILKELEDLGPGYSKVIQQLNKMSDKDLAAWVKAWETKSALAKKAAEKELGQKSGTAADVAATQASESYADALNAQSPEVTKAAVALAEAAKTGATVSLTTIGADAGQSFADGIRSKIEEVRAASTEMGNAVPTQVRTELDQHSPSRVMIGAGGDTAMGYILGILGLVDQARQAGGMLGRAAIPAVDTSGIGMLNISPAATSGLQRVTSAGAGGVQRVEHVFSGTVRGEAIDTRGQMQAFYEFVVDQIVAEARA